MNTSDGDTNTATRENPAWPATVKLAASGVALVLALPVDSLPIPVYWGADPGDLSQEELDAIAAAAIPPRATNGVDVPVAVSLIPEGRTGWLGSIGLEGHRSGADWSPWMKPTAIDRVSTEQSEAINVVALDEQIQLELGIRVEMLPSGVLRMQTRITNRGANVFTVNSLSMALPVPAKAVELWDFAGRWAKERVVQHRKFTVGSHLREGRRGRTGADAAMLLTAGTKDLDFGTGEGWGVHVAFSGNHRLIGERSYSGERLLFGGELLLPGEVELQEGESYSSPKVFGVYGHGFDEMAARVHQYLRARPHHPRSPRPVVMNVWEAVYFDHDLNRLLDLADRAAEVGVERFVLDDGWFGARRDDTAGLGDWELSDEVWGEGRFAELVAGVKARGMQFGLWFEPEMVNLNSDLARAHPEWLLQVPGRLPVESRHQQVLDLTHPGAFEHVRRQIVALVRDYGIDFVKWDHNRDLVDAGSTRTNRAGVHAQTEAVYRLLDTIRADCPALEIESCSSGGARVDLEILEHTDRVWASDCIDARERQAIQRWTGQLLPPELVGSHVGAGTAHTTGRVLDLDFRCATALFGHFGIEWDLSAASQQELDRLAQWVDFYKQHRQLIHSGTSFRRDLEQGEFWLTGVVAKDQLSALYAVTLRDRLDTWPAGRVQLPGLLPETQYRVSATGPGVEMEFDDRVHPHWWREGIILSGRTLAEIGLHMPALNPDHSALLNVEAVTE